jgi:hypothetical protein
MMAPAKTFQRILQETQCGARITGTDEAFLLEQIQRHPSKEEKIGCGISHFTVDHHPVRNRQKAFYIVRTDGARMNFGYRKCLDKPPATKELVMQALRADVADQIAACRGAAFNGNVTMICPITGENTWIADSDVHHTGGWPFNKIAEAFVAEAGGYESIRLKKGPKIGRGLADSELAASWRQFHAARAELICISREAHRNRNGITN